MELTGTNRPKTYSHYSCWWCLRSLYSFETTSLGPVFVGWVVVWWFCGGDSLGETPSILFEPGELSPVVLMVLHLGGCGRVDGCRNKYFV